MFVSVFVYCLLVWHFSMETFLHWSQKPCCCRCFTFIWPAGTDSWCHPHHCSSTWSWAVNLNWGLTAVAGEEPQSKAAFTCRCSTLCSLKTCLMLNSTCNNTLRMLGGKKQTLVSLGAQTPDKVRMTVNRLGSVVDLLLENDWKTPCNFVVILWERLNINQCHSVLLWCSKTSQ